MPAASSRLLIGWFHLAVVVAIVGFSVAAVRHRPPTRLIGQAKVNAGTTLTLRDGSGGYPGSSSRPDVRPTLGQDPDPLTATAAKNRLTAGHRSWDMDLRLDDTIRPPGWPWTLHEGKNQGEGYELHWLPERLVLQVQRSRPRTFLLGSTHLAATPRLVSFQRRGGQLVVIADGVQVLRCLDPDGPLDDDPRAWSCSTSGTLGDAMLTVQSVELISPQWGSGGDSPPPSGTWQTDGPFRAVHAALHVRGTLEQVEPTFGLAQEQLGSRRGIQDSEQPGRALTPPDRARLRLWLALARIRWQLSAGDPGDEATFHLVEEDIDTLFTVTDHDETLRHGAMAPEMAGILLSLTEPLAQRACAIPSAAITDRPELVNDRIFAHRQRWTDLLGRVVARVESLASSDLAPDDIAQVRLLLHAAGCLRGEDPLPPVVPTGDGWLGVPMPLAVDAPQWLAGRWRAFAGGDPAMESFPPLSGNPGPAAAAIGHLADYVDMDPVPAIGLRTQVLDFFARRERLLPLGRESESARSDLEDKALRACDRPGTPAREQLLARALVVLALDGDRQRSMLRPLREALINSDLVRTDPLAYALDQLLVHRFASQVATPRTSSSTSNRDFYQLDDTARISRYFPEYQVLMEGTAAANARIWRVRMPHAQALAVALIMQEVAGLEPAWGLLERVPGFTLPLPLLARIRAPAPIDGGAAIAPVPSGGSVAP